MPVAIYASVGYDLKRRIEHSPDDHGDNGGFQNDDERMMGRNANYIEDRIYGNAMKPRLAISSYHPAITSASTINTCGERKCPVDLHP